MARNPNDPFGILDQGLEKMRDPNSEFQRAYRQTFEPGSNFMDGWNQFMRQGRYSPRTARPSSRANLDLYVLELTAGRETTKYPVKGSGPRPQQDQGVSILRWYNQDNGLYVIPERYYSASDDKTLVGTIRLDASEQGVDAVFHPVRDQTVITHVNRTPLSVDEILLRRKGTIHTKYGLVSYQVSVLEPGQPSDSLYQDSSLRTPFRIRSENSV